MAERKNTYFASLNTVKGFKSYFSHIFNPNELQRIYILKGGPGTGKSSFLKKVADTEEKNGHHVERFLCSSDPNSLDGILIAEKKVALLDGTSPHMTDPDYPGVVESIINLGEYWNTQMLLEHKKTILKLIQEKRRNYNRAYQFLSAFGELTNEILDATKKHLKEEKMIQNIKVQTKKCFSKEQSNTIQYRNTETICQFGFIKTDTFEHSAKKVWIVEDFNYTAVLYLDAIKQIAIQNGQSIVISLSPLFPDKPNALYFPETQSCFIIGSRNYEKEFPLKEYRYINMKRFLISEELAKYKQKIKFCKKCASTLLSEAISSLEEAAEHHGKLEEIYVEAMDFEKLNHRTEKTILQIHSL